MLHADLIRPSELSASDVALWKAMRDATPEFRSPLLGPGFALAVGAVRDDARVAVLQRDGATVGFLAHHRASGGYARPIGAPFSDYHALISAPGAALSLEAALAAAGLKRLRFTGALNPHGAFTQGLRCSEPAYRMAPGELGADAYLAALRERHAKYYKRLRQLTAKIERDLGPITLSAEPGAEALGRAFAWKRDQLRRSGLHDVLGPRWVQALMYDLLGRHEGFGGLHVVLRAGGRQIASSFGPREARAFHSWIATYDPELSEYAPGRVLHFRAITALPHLGLDLWDLGPGHGDWKRRFALEPITVHSGLAESGGASRRRLKPPTSGVVERIAGRLEHIAAAEPTVSGRIGGVLAALRHGHRRFSGGAAAET